MKEEFIELYLDWHNIVDLQNTGIPKSNKQYNKLKEWCQKNKKESLEYIKEILENEPDTIVMILNDLFKDDYKIEYDDFISLDKLCNLWLNTINRNVIYVDYYREYNKWQNHLNKYYRNWRPNIEDDPNVTLEEYKQGKRNKGNYDRKFHEFSLSILNDNELEKLMKDGHIGEMTKYIEELKFFYNRVNEEIKRRKLNNK